MLTTLPALPRTISTWENLSHLALFLETFKDIDQQFE